jgi:hypothetical protein
VVAQWRMIVSYYAHKCRQPAWLSERVDDTRQAMRWQPWRVCDISNCPMHERNAAAARIVMIAEASKDFFHEQCMTQP